MRHIDKRLQLIIPASLLATAPAICHALTAHAAAPSQTVSHWNYSSQCVTATHWHKDTEALVKNTLPNEWYPSDDDDALKAGASIIRQTSWYYYNHRESGMFCAGVTSYTYDWRDSRMAFVNSSGQPTTDSATSATFGWGWSSSSKSANNLKLDFNDCLQLDTQAQALAGYGWVDIVGSSSYPPGVYSQNSPCPYYYAGLAQAILYK